MVALNPGQPVASGGVGDAGTQIDRAILNRAGIGAAVENGRDLHACGHQRTGAGTGTVVVGKERHALTGDNAIAVQIGFHRTGHHDAGAIIHREGNRPFQRARGKDRAARGDAPEAFARHIGTGGLVQGDAFKRGKDAVIIGPGHRGAAHNPDIGQRGEFGLGRGHPVQPRRAVDGLTVRDQTPAKAAVLIGQNDISPGAGGSQGRHQPGRATADDQKIAKGESLFVMPLIMAARETAQPCRAADGGLIDPLPKGARPHEGLVVKARRKERGQKVVHRQKVKAQGPHAVLAAGGQPLEQLLHGGADVRGLVGGADHFDHRVRLFRSGGQHPTRAVVLETPPHHFDAIGQKRRGDSVALEPLIRLAVKGKADGLCAVDQPLACDPHFAPPFRSATSSAL